jgi:uncharacterized membrane protein YraQ (UPF0718 family)
MDAASLVIWLIALAMGAMALRRSGKLFREGMTRALGYVLTMGPRMVVAVLVSGFFSAIIPTNLVAAWLGDEAGMKGVLIGSAVGGLMPGGPIICFPIVFILFEGGAGMPSLIAFLTAWSVFAFHRIIAYEIPLMGLHFAMIRILASAILPPLAGILALVIEAHLPA